LKVDEPAEGACGIAVSADGKLLASAHHGRVRIWDLKTGKPLRDLTDLTTFFGSNTHDLEFSPDGKLLAERGGGDAIGVWGVADGERHLDFPQSHTSDVEAVAYFPDGRLVVTGGRDGTVRVWDVAAARELHNLKLGPGRSGVSAVAVSPDGKTVAAGGVEPSD